MIDNEFNPNTAQVQKIFKGLKIYSQIGSGGQKIVYKADHPQYGKVALKLIRPESSKVKERILREISVSIKLSGPSFSKIYDYGEKKFNSENILYFFEEFLEGQNLRDILLTNGKLSLIDTLSLTKSLLEILVEVNKESIVHRDIKPENVFLTNDNRIVLIDFGIARHLNLPSLTHDYALLGPLTPGYASPEQIKNEKRKIDTRTDIFLLGIVVYECLIGYNPFIRDCSDAREVINRNLNFNPQSLSILGCRKDISDFVETCLQKHPNRRYSNPYTALQIIQNILNEVNLK